MGFTQQSFAILFQSLDIYMSLTSYKHIEFSENLAQMSICRTENYEVWHPVNACSL